MNNPTHSRQARRVVPIYVLLALAVVVLLLLSGCRFDVAFPNSRPTATPSPSAASPAALADLSVAKPEDDNTYERDAFGDGWADLDSDGCETRDEILARDLTNVVTDDGCDVKSGTLHDPYTGQTIHFTDDEWWTVHVDHIYPLAHAWRMGADDWTAEKRLRFANDPINLLAVDGPTNSSKGDSGPGEWVPLTRDYACTYGRKYVRVATTYNLPVTDADRDSLAALLATCD